MWIDCDYLFHIMKTMQKDGDTNAREDDNGSSNGIPNRQSFIEQISNPNETPLSLQAGQYPSSLLEDGGIKHSDIMYEYKNHYLLLQQPNLNVLLCLIHNFSSS